MTPRNAAPRLAIRLTAEEAATLRAAARRSGLGLGPWLRMLGLIEAHGDPRNLWDRVRDLGHDPGPLPGAARSPRARKGKAP